MKHAPRCVPCFLQRVLSMANLVTEDEWLHRKLLGETMADLARVDDEATPPEVMFEIYRRTARTLGSADPYHEEKKRWRDEVLANSDGIRALAAESGDPFLWALRASGAANVVDDELREGIVLKTLLDRVPSTRLDPDAVDAFRSSVRGARRILFVHDTVGELFFDRLLIEALLREAGEGASVVSVVRAGKVLGDATREDAEAMGLGEVAEVTDPGLECLGLPVSECAAEFRESFKAADLVIAKGQACYQSLEADGRMPDGQEKEVWFLFRVKCPVMARQLAVEIGDLFLERN